MNSIKSYFGIIAILALFSATLIAQPERGPRGHHGKPSVEKMKADLNLTENQATQMEAIFNQFKADAQALKADESITEEAKREAFKSLREQQKIAVDNILTAEQKEVQKAKRLEQRTMMQKQKTEKRKYLQSIDRKGMQNEMKAYHKENIRPVMLEQRLKLENSLLPEDKATISGLRETAKAAKAKMKAAREAFKGNKKAGEKPSGDHRQEMQNLMAPFKAEMIKAEALATKYDVEITALFEEISSEKNQWKEDKKAIRQKYIPENKPEGFDKNRKSTGDQCTHKKKGKGHHADKPKGYGKKVRFLLMDPDGEASAAEIATASTIRNIRVYPNPSQSANKLEYEITQSGMVIVALQNQQGQVVKTLSNKFHEAGTYTIDVDLSGIKGNVFYYMIKDKSGVQTQKFIKAPGY